MTGEHNLKPVEMKDLAIDQKEDLIIGPVYESVVLGVRPEKKQWKSLNRRTKVTLKNFNKLRIVDGTLGRETNKSTQIVLPTKHHKLIYTELRKIWLMWVQIAS